MKEELSSKLDRSAVSVLQTLGVSVLVELADYIWKPEDAKADEVFESVLVLSLASCSAASVLLGKFG